MSTSQSHPSNATVLTQMQAIIAGIEKHFPNGTFTLGNTAYTTATLTQALQGLANALSDLSAAHAHVKQAGLTLTEMQTKVGPLVRNCKSFILAAFGTSPLTLADFGMLPTKARTPLTTEQKAGAVAKSRATRKARGTMGPKKRLTVKGDVTSVTITPVTSPAATSPSATPAAPASTTSA